jgi:hypothetical protein
MAVQKKRAPAPEPPTPERRSMNDPANLLYLSRQTEEIWVLFDCRVPRMSNRLHRERQAWGSRANVENLGSGCVILVVRPGGARGAAA